MGLFLWFLCKLYKFWKIITSYRKTSFDSNFVYVLRNSKIVLRFILQIACAWWFLAFCQKRGLGFIRICPGLSGYIETCPGISWVHQGNSKTFFKWRNSVQLEHIGRYINLMFSRILAAKTRKNSGHTRGRCCN